MVITSFPQVFAARQPLELEISYSKAKRIILRDVLRTDRNFHYFRCEHILPSFSLSPSLPRRPSPAPTFHTSLLSPLSLSFMFALTHSLTHSLSPPPPSLSLCSHKRNLRKVHRILHIYAMFHPGQNRHTLESQPALLGP